MSDKQRSKMVSLANQHHILPEPDEPLEHFEAKCRVLKLGQDGGWIGHVEHYWGKRKYPNKGYRMYTSDIYFEHPVIEARSFIVEVNGRYHDTDFHVKHKKTENRKEDLEWLTGWPVIIFSVEEALTQPESYLMRQMGIGNRLTI